MLLVVPTELLIVRVGDREGVLEHTMELSLEGRRDGIERRSLLLALAGLGSRAMVGRPSALPPSSLATGLADRQLSPRGGTT